MTDGTVLLLHSMSTCTGTSTGTQPNSTVANTTSSTVAHPSTGTSSLLQLYRIVLILCVN